MLSSVTILILLKIYFTSGWYKIYIKNQIKKFYARGKLIMQMYQYPKWIITRSEILKHFWLLFQNQFRNWLVCLEYYATWSSISDARHRICWVYLIPGIITDKDKVIQDCQTLVTGNCRSGRVLLFQRSFMPAMQISSNVWQMLVT